MSLLICDFIDYKDEYTKISRSTLVQDAIKMFNEAKVKPKKCVDLLNKIIYLLNQVGEREFMWFREKHSQILRRQASSLELLSCSWLMIPP